MTSDSGIKPAALLLLLSHLLAGCGTPDTTAPGQVLARVNGTEISVHQLNTLGITSSEPAAAQRQALLDKLVDRELAVQQALAQQLERQPEVMLRLEEARRNVLAEAWTAQLTATLPPPDQNEVARYFAAHPGLFSQRKLYHLRELALPVTAAESAEMAARVKQGQSVDEIAAWLRAQKAEVSERTLIRLAEQLPIEVADRLYQVPTGQAAAFQSSRAVTLYQVHSAELLPVSWSQAEPIIKNFLTTQARNRSLESDMAQRRKQAKIEYLQQANASGVTE